MGSGKEEQGSSRLNQSLIDFYYYVPPGWHFLGRFFRVFFLLLLLFSVVRTVIHTSKKALINIL